MKKKKGFTLLELLAVIVILGIILAIAIPNILNLIKKAKEDAFERQKDLILDVTQKYILQNGDNLTWTDGSTTIHLKDLQDAHLIDNPLRDPRGGCFDNSEEGTRIIVTEDGDDYTYEIITVVDNDTTPPVLALVGGNPITIDQWTTYSDLGATATDNKDGNISNRITFNHNIDTTTVGTYTVTYNVFDNAGNRATPITRTVNVQFSDFVPSKGVNHPRLLAGMTPIKWNGSAWVDTVSNDPDWYNYTTADKKWANAKTTDGSMWVWIPRFAYQMVTGYHINYANGGMMYIKFLKNDTNVAANDSTVDTVPIINVNSQTNYVLHPAFKFGSTEVTGMWVAKFETSVANTSDLCYTNSSIANCNKTTLTPKIVPSVKSWRNINIDNAFTVTRNMETNNTYGWGTTGNGLDTHLIKNIEWGAVSYLTQSNYGQNQGSEVWINPANDFTTGCAGSSASSAASSGCLNAYNTANGINASTTGNIYGIYDMNGGSFEHVSAYINNGNSALTTNGNSIITAASKYKDIYTVTTDNQATNYSNAANIVGDTTYATSLSSPGSTGWYGDYSNMPYLDNPYFILGGNYNFTTNSGLFSFTPNTGVAGSDVSFRPILLIKSGL